MFRSRKPRKHVMVRLRQRNKSRTNYSFSKGGVLKYVTNKLSSNNKH